jgi:hypothetical protein
MGEAIQTRASPSPARVCVKTRFVVDAPAFMAGEKYGPGKS